MKLVPTSPALNRIEFLLLVEPPFDLHLIYIYVARLGLIISEIYLFYRLKQRHALGHYAGQTFYHSQSLFTD